MMVAALALVSCTKHELEPLTGIFPEATVVELNKLTSCVAEKDAADRRVFTLDLTDGSTPMHLTLIGNKYFLTANQYIEALDAVAKNGNFVLGKSSIAGKNIKQGYINVDLLEENETDNGCENTYSISAVVFLEDGTPYKANWEGKIAFEKDAVLAPEFFFTDTVAQDCTLEDGQTLVTDVESHTLVLNDANGNFAAQIKLIRSVGTKNLAGKYTVKEYAHEDLSAGNGFDLGVYFGLPAGSYVIGSYYVKDGAVVIIEPGATIDVSDMGEGIYMIEGNGFSFLTAPEGWVPGGLTVCDMTDTVAQDCTLEDGQTAVTDVESHTLVLMDGEAVAAQIKLIRSVGTTDLAGTYTVKEYAHEDLTAGNGFDLGVYFGMPAGSYVIGTYYIKDGAAVLVEPGETITVTSMGENTYKFEGSSEWAFVGKLAENSNPGGETHEEVSLYLNEFDCQNKKLEIYNPNNFDVDLTGWTLSKDETVWTIPASHASVPANGYIVYTGKSDGTNDPTFGLSGTKGFVVVLTDKEGHVVDKVDNSSAREGGIVQIPDGKSWGRKTDGAAEFVLFDTPTIGAANGAGSGSESVTLAAFLSLTDYSAYNMNMVGIELGTEGFYYNAPDWVTSYTASYPVDGQFIKLELYAEGGVVAPGTYVPSAANGAVNAGEFNLGADNGWGGFNGTSWFTVTSGAAKGVAVTDGTVTVSKEGDVYTIAIETTAVKATYVGKLSK